MANLPRRKASVILVEPLYSGNVGATARAMQNLGFQDLRLVNPCPYLNQEGRQFAVNAVSILEQAKHYPDLESALWDKSLIIGTSARLRGRHQQVHNNWQINQIPQIEGNEESIAFVFGREPSGLTNREMDLCTDWITIPSAGENSSYNLSQAVLLVLYEFARFKSFNQTTSQSEINVAFSRELEGLKVHLFEVLHQISFLKPGKEPTIWSSFSDMLARGRASSRDVRMIRGFLNRIQISLGVKTPRKNQLHSGK